MSKKQKLFVSWDGSDPDCYEGKRLYECMGELLSCTDVDDELVQYVLEDMQTFASEEADEEGRIKKKFLTACMSCSAQWCYGYDSFEEAFNDDKNVPCVSCGDSMYPLHYNSKCPSCFQRDEDANTNR